MNSFNKNITSTWQVVFEKGRKNAGRFCPVIAVAAADMWWCLRDSDGGLTCCRSRDRPIIAFHVLGKETMGSFWVWNQVAVKLCPKDLSTERKYLILSVGMIFLILTYTKSMAEGKMLSKIGKKVLVPIQVDFVIKFVHVIRETNCLFTWSRTISLLCSFG